MARVLEVCVDSVESAVSAARGGAMRLELCANLVIGGTSPDEDLFRMVRRRVDIPIRVLLRPRFGDFLYSEEEFELLRRQVRRFAALGADGVVIGVLRADGTLDEPRMAELIALAGGCGITLHLSLIHILPCPIPPFIRALPARLRRAPSGAAICFQYTMRRSRGQRRRGAQYLRKDIVFLPVKRYNRYGH